MFSKIFTWSNTCFFIMRKNYLQMIRVFKIRVKMIRVVLKLEKFYLVNSKFYVHIYIVIYSNDLYLLI